MKAIVVLYGDVREVDVPEDALELGYILVALKRPFDPSGKVSKHFVPHSSIKAFHRGRHKDGVPIFEYL